MMLFRSLTLGLLGACVYLLAAVRALPPPEVARSYLQAPVTSSIPEVANNQVTVIDVAKTVGVTMLPSLIRLGADERIVAVNDVFTENSLAAAMQVTDQYRQGKTLDLTVSGDNAGVRRVLVIRH